MIYVFNNKEELQAIYSNENKDACPYFVADLTEELNGPITLEIEIPADHQDAEYLTEEAMLAIKDREGEWQAFFVREIEEEHGADGIKKRAYSEHVIVELDDEEPIEKLDIDRKDTHTALDRILEGTRWEARRTENTEPHTFTGEYINRLEAFNTFKERWNVEIKYSLQIAGTKIVGRYIDAVRQRGQNTGKRFEFNKDIETIRRTIDATNVRTALIGLGEGEGAGAVYHTVEEGETAESIASDNGLTINQLQELNPNVNLDTIREGDALVLKQAEKIKVTFSDINGGKNYVENNQARQRYGRLDENGNMRHRYGILEVKSDNKEEILAETQKALETLSKPLIQYDASVVDLAKILDVEHEAVHLGQIVALIDKDLGLKLQARVIKLKTDLLDDAMSEVTLGNFLPIQSQTLEERLENFENRLNEAVLHTDIARQEIKDKADVATLIELQEALGQKLEQEDLIAIEKALGEKADQTAINAIEEALGETVTQEQLEAIEKALADKAEAEDLAQIEQILGRKLEDSDLTAIRTALTEKADEQAIKDIEAILGRKLEEGDLQDIKDILDKKLDRGEAIKTDWLQGTINALQNQVIAGSGTVELTDHDGIIIYDRAENPTSALRLMGGLFAIADKKDPVTGLWDWRTFGSADGFTADEIIAGTLKGVSLDLGGANNSDGVLVVKNERGEETVRLSGNYGGFAEVNIDYLKDTKNVVFKTSYFSENMTNNASIDYYVDPHDGDNSNEGDSEAPLASVQEALDRLPKHLEHDVYIYYLGARLRETNIKIEGFTGNGTIYLRRWVIPIRYIRDWISGSTANLGNHWVEIYSIRTDGNTLYGFGRDVEVMSGANQENKHYVNDGNIASNRYYTSQTHGPSYVQIYLNGAHTNINYTKVWHYYLDGRTYYGTKTEISEDGERWFKIFDSEREGTYKETEEGHLIHVKRAYLSGNLEVRNNSCVVRIEDLIVDGSEGNIAPITIYNSKNVYLRECIFFGSESNTLYTVNAYNSFVRLVNNEINTASTAGINSQYGSVVTIYSCVGSGFDYGMRAWYGGIIAGGYNSTAPIGRIQQTFASSGGIEANKNWKPTAGEFSPIKIVAKTGSWKNTSGKTYAIHKSTWDSTTSEILQGKYSSWGPYKGLWFWGSAIRNTVRGKDIKKIRVWVQRVNSAHGYATKASVIIRYHGYASQPSGEPSLSSAYKSVSLGRGESAWVDVTSQFKSAFESGSAYGIGVYTTSTSGSNYARMTPNARIEITYEEETT